jgi:hypothetical protein
MSRKKVKRKNGIAKRNKEEQEVTCATHLAPNESAQSHDLKSVPDYKASF